MCHAAPPLNQQAVRPIAQDDVEAGWVGVRITAEAAFNNGSSIMVLQTRNNGSAPLRQAPAMRVAADTGNTSLLGVPSVGAQLQVQVVISNT